jgi:hypothetical protein
MKLPTNPLESLLPKVKIIKEKESTAAQAAKNLRDYFKLFDARTKKKKNITATPRFTLYKEPFPYLLHYEPMDDTIPLDKEYYSNYRIAYCRLMRALTAHKKEQAKKRKLSSL